MRIYFFQVQVINLLYIQYNFLNLVHLFGKFYNQLSLQRNGGNQQNLMNRKILRDIGIFNSVIFILIYLGQILHRYDNQNHYYKLNIYYCYIINNSQNLLLINHHNIYQWGNDNSWKEFLNRKQFPNHIARLINILEDLLHLYKLHNEFKNLHIYKSYILLGILYNLHQLTYHNTQLSINSYHY